jgi:hypothetical protein
VSLTPPLWTTTRPLVVHVHTVPRARVSVSLEVSVVATHPRSRASRPAVVFHATWSGQADGRRQYSLRLSVPRSLGGPSVARLTVRVIVGRQTALLACPWRPGTCSGPRAPTGPTVTALPTATPASTSALTPTMTAAPSPTLTPPPSPTAMPTPLALATSTPTTTSTPTRSANVPQQLSPPDGTVFTNYPRTTTLRWSGVPGAATYAVEIQYCVPAGCASGAAPEGSVQHVTTTEYTFDFAGAQPGRWRVWAVDATGQEGPKSDWWGFKYTQ